MFRFQLTTTLCYGPDSLSALSDLDGRRKLIITDAFMATTPLMEQVRKALSAATVEVFDQVIPNPDITAVAAGLRAFLAFGPEAMVALGGGSPIDTAKAVRKLALEQGHRTDAGFYVIPTTSGSGSEVTSFSVVTDPHSHVKLPLFSDDMLPDVAILDPEAVAPAPPRLVADSGMDAVSHAIEAYVALGHNDFSDALAEKALRIADTYLVRSFRSNTDLKAREHQHTGATMAGIAFQNAGLGIVHSLSHSIGGSFKVAHGRLNGILLPHVIEYNAGVLGVRPSYVSDVGRRYVSLARAIGLTASSDRNVVFGLVADIEKAARDIVNGASFDNNLPCTAEKEVIAVECVADLLKFEMAKNGAYELRDPALIAKLEALVVSGRHAVTDWVGKDAWRILEAIGVVPPPGTRLIIAEVPFEHPFVRVELMMPILPIVRAKNVAEAIDMAVIAEHGNRHTAIMHSTDVNALTRMAKRIQTTIFVKNGPSYAGIGIGGEGYCSFTIAGPTGEGLTSARTFARRRRCVLVGGLNVR